MGRDTDASGGSANGGNGEGNEGRSGGSRGGDFGGLSFGGGFGLSSLSGNTTQSVGVSFGGFGPANSRSIDRTGLNTVQSNKSVDEAQAALDRRVKDNAFASKLALGMQVLGAIGVPGMQMASMAMRAVSKYGRGVAELTSMERAAAALGMGSTSAGSTGATAGMQVATSTVAGNISSTATVSNNQGTGASGASVQMGAPRTGAGSGARGSTGVRGFGSGGLRI